MKFSGYLIAIQTQCSYFVVNLYGHAKWHRTRRFKVVIQARGTRVPLRVWNMSAV